MKLQITVFFAFVAAAAAAKLPIDQFKQQAMSAQEKFQNKISATWNSNGKAKTRKKFNFEDVKQRLIKELNDIEKEGYYTGIRPQRVRQPMKKRLNGLSKNQKLRISNNLTEREILRLHRTKMLKNSSKKEFTERIRTNVSRKNGIRKKMSKTGGFQDDIF